MPELRPVNPLEIGTSESLGFVFPQCAAVEINSNCFLRIRVRKALKKRADHDLDPEFFLEFASQTCLESFAWLAFASWKFP
jgi:hypothetical protein